MAMPLMYYSEIPRQLEYQPGQKNITNVHIGQLKLFLGELEFLTDYITDLDSPCILVYAGSAPCNHAAYLSKMYPNLKIIMVDPAEHYIMYPDNKTMYSPEYINEIVFFKCTQGNRYNHVGKRTIQIFDGTKVVKLDRDDKKIEEISENFLKSGDHDDLIDFILNNDYKYYIIEDYFTDILAHLFTQKKLGSFMFCSDIRTNIHDQAGLFAEESPSDLDILWNSSMQYNWLNEMQPTAAMLKFRCPFFNKRDKQTFRDYISSPDFRQKDFDLSKKLGIDFLDDYAKEKFVYYQPKHIYIQSFAGKTSAETRLVIDTNKYPAELYEFDCKEYEEKMNYYNQIHRQLVQHTGYQTILDESLGINEYADCALMYEIFKRYYQKYFGTSSSQTIKKDIVELLKSIRRKLK